MSPENLDCLASAFYSPKGTGNKEEIQKIQWMSAQEWCVWKQNREGCPAGGKTIQTYDNFGMWSWSFFL